MSNSKDFIESSDSNKSDEETVKAPVTKKSKGKKSNDDDNPPAKRTKKSDETENAPVASTTGANGERLYEIGKSRYVSVSEFKKKAYVNIREYYDDNGVQKPGKKGISLPAEQWEILKSLMNHVDKELSAFK